MNAPVTPYRPAGLRHVSEFIHPIMAGLTRLVSYTAKDGMVCGLWSPAPMTTAQARQQILRHAESAIAGVCDDQTAGELIGDLIRAIREAEGTDPTPPTAANSIAQEEAA